MQHTRISLFGMLSMAMIFAMPLVATQSAAAAQASTPAPASGKVGDGKIYFCIEGLEQILPGDYYACRAKYHFQREHYRRAIGMLEEASYWANKDAQYTLGLIYFDGDTPGIPANRPLGIAWLALAAERKNPVYTKTYTIAELKSTPAEVQEAARLWLRMKQKYGDKVAGERALRRFNHEIVPLEQLANSDGIVYLSGYSPIPENAPNVISDLHARADRDFDGMNATVTVGALHEK